KYSLKDLEPFHRFERVQPLKTVGAAQRVIQRSLELGAPAASIEDQVRIVEAYNLEDCFSARALRDWLEELRAGVVAGGVEIQRPHEEPGAPSDEIRERERLARELAAILLAGVPEERGERTEEQHARWLLAHLLDWHRREEKAPWWEYFRLREQSDEELLDEMSALAGLTFVERLGGAVDRYRFAPQETKIRSGDKLHLTGPESRRFGVVEEIDFTARTVDIKKSGATAEIHPTSL